MLPKGWKSVLLDQAAKRGSGHTPSKDFPEYWNGGIKWISLADSSRLDKGLVAHTDKEISSIGVRNSSAVVHPAGTVVLSRDAGVGKSGVIAEDMAVSQHFIAWDCSNSTELLNWYLYHWLQQQKPEFERVAVGSTIKTIGLPYFKKLKITLPPYSEQRRIAQILSTWDQAIATMERLLLNSQEQKLLISQQMLTGKIRIKDFPSSGRKQKTPYGPLPIEWGYRRIGELAVEVSQKLRDEEPYPVLSCTKHKGLVDSLAYFNKQVFSADTSTYKVAPKRCFVYATNHINEGSIGYQDLYDFGLVSPMYTVFKANDEVDDAYLFALLKTEHYRQIFASATNASVDRRGSLRWKDFRNLHIPLPSIEEQRAIARVLASAVREAELIQAQLGLLRDEKAALMSQLLTGKRRVKLPDAETEVQA